MGFAALDISRLILTSWRSTWVLHSLTCLSLSCSLCAHEWRGGISTQGAELMQWWFRALVRVCEWGRSCRFREALWISFSQKHLIGLRRREARASVSVRLLTSAGILSLKRFILCLSSLWTHIYPVSYLFIFPFRWRWWQRWGWRGDWCGHGGAQAAA